MLTLPILVAVVSAAAVAVAGLAYRAAPTHVRCPDCGKRTRVVIPRIWPPQMARHMTWRWCPACEWEGMAKRGPEYVPGRPAAHDSGFHWGAERMGPDMGFQWAPSLPDPAPDEPPPSHPSGFRWSTKTRPAPVAQAGAFQWKDDLEAPASLPSPAHPSGFSWGDHRPRPRFEWGTRGRSPSHRAPPGFRWKDAS